MTLSADERVFAMTGFLTVAEYRRAREPTWLYRLWSEQDELLYIGITTGIGRRFDQHRNRDWWPEVVKITLERHPSIRTAEAAELAALQTENPRHNVRGVPGRMRTAQAAANELRKSTRELTR